MPDYLIPTLIPVRAINRANLDATVANTFLYHQRQIRKAASETEKFNGSAKNEATTLEEQIDEFTRHDLNDEYRFLGLMKNVEHHLSPHQEEAAGL